jgi:hypothetical protein
VEQLVVLLLWCSCAKGCLLIIVHIHGVTIGRVMRTAAAVDDRSATLNLANSEAPQRPPKGAE